MARRSAAARNGVLAASAIGLLGAVTGCADRAIVSNSYYDVSYSPGEWRGNDLPVVVRGSAFPVPQADFDDAVADALQGTTFGVPTRFVAAPQGSAQAYRVVVSVNPLPGTASTALCLRPGPPPAALGVPPSSSAPMIAALCRGDRAISTAEGLVATGDSAESAVFRDSVRDFGRQLFPPDNPENRGGMEFSD